MKSEEFPRQERIAGPDLAVDPFEFRLLLKNCQRVMFINEGETYHKYLNGMRGQFPQLQEQLDDFDLLRLVVVHCYSH